MNYAPHKVLYIVFLGLIFMFEQTLNRITGNNVTGASIFILTTLPFLLSRTLFRKNVGKLILILIILTIYSAFGSILNKYCSIGVKGIFSIFLLWMVLLAMNLAPILLFLRTRIITSAILIVVTILNLPVYFGLFKHGLFNEPSHFALYIIPLLAYRLLSNSKDSLGMLCLVAGFILLPSTTLLMGSLLIGLVVFLSKSKKIISPRTIIASFAVLLLLYMIIADVLPMPDTKARIINLFVGDEVEAANHLNLSSIVWLNGWSQAYQTFMFTYGIGLGFNQMGCGSFREIGYYSPLIQAAFSGDMLNAEDGSLLSAKLISELGYAGLFIIIILFCKSFVAIRDMIQCRAFCGTVKHDIHVLRATGAISILILLFVRSGPYFVMPVILAISMLFFSSEVTRSIRKTK